jgi:hypothetical protein
MQKCFCLYLICLLTLNILLSSCIKHSFPFSLTKAYIPSKIPMLQSTSTQPINAADLHQFLLWLSEAYDQASAQQKHFLKHEAAVYWTMQDVGATPHLLCLYNFYAEQRRSCWEYSNYLLNLFDTAKLTPEKLVYCQLCNPVRAIARQYGLLSDS